MTTVASSRIYLQGLPNNYRLVGRVLFVAFIALLSPGLAGATTYYVDNSAKNASDQNSGTSTAAPFKSLTRISHHAFKPGDTIAFKAGTRYFGGLAFTASGTAKSPITLTSYGTGAKPIFSNNAAYGSYSNAADLVGASYVVVKGLKFTSASLAGLQLDANSNHNIIDGNEVQKVGIGFRVFGQYNLFQNNTVSDGVMVRNTQGGEDDYGANGFLIAAANNEFAHNTCERCAAKSYDFGMDGGMFELYGKVDNTFIHHNVARDSQGFIEANSNPAVAGADTAMNVRIEYNLSSNNLGKFMVVHFRNGPGNWGISRSSIRVANNTIVDLTSHVAGSLNYVDQPPADTSITFVNNIFVVNNIGSIYKYKIKRSTNLYLFMQKATHLMNNWDNTLGPGEMYSNPKFTDTTKKNFHLTSGSPALKKGTTLSPFSPTDMDGKAVPKGQKPDLGAYQYTNITNSKTK